MLRFKWLVEFSLGDKEMTDEQKKFMKSKLTNLLISIVTTIGGMLVGLLSGGNVNIGA